MYEGNISSTQLLLVCVILDTALHKMKFYWTEYLNYFKAVYIDIYKQHLLYLV